MSMLKGEKGFTMLEAMVSVMIMSIMVILTMQAFTTGSRMWDVTYTSSRLAGESRMAVERISRELRNSALTRISIPQTGVLQFQVPSSVDTNGNITWSGWFQYNIGGLDNEQLIRQDLTAGTSTVVANKVTTLQFVSNANPPTLTVNLTVQDATDYGTVIPVPLSTTVELRN